MHSKTIRLFKFLILTIALGRFAVSNAQMSLQGAFAVSPTGAATYSVPIQLPPGINGVAPRFSFEYSSQANNGVMGVGWNLSGLSSIVRCASTVPQDGLRRAVYFKDTDRYCLDGQRLIVVSGVEGGAAEYRLEKDPFTKVVSYVDANFGGGIRYFLLLDKNGNKRFYGGNANLSLDSRLKRSPVSATAKVVAWPLTEEVSSIGLNIIYEYQSDGYDFLINSVKYATLPGKQVVMNFNYDEQISPRVDYFKSYAISFFLSSDFLNDPYRLINRKTLTSISVQADSALVRKYKISYAAGNGLTRDIHLSKIDICESSGGCVSGLTVKQNDNPVVKYVESTSYRLPDFLVRDDDPRGGLNGGLVFMDINNDGLVDVIKSIYKSSVDKYNLVWLNTGSGWQLSSRYSIPGGDYLVRLDGVKSPLQFVDLNGDGLSDLVSSKALYLDTELNPAMNPVVESAWINNGTGWTYAPNYVSAETSVRAKFFDYNGDGLTDFVKASITTNYPLPFVLNNGNGWNSRLTGEKHNFMGADFIDVNSDGLIDSVLNSTNSIPSVNFSDIGGFLYANGSPSDFRLPKPIVVNGEPVSHAYIDFNGDGLNDLWYRDSIYINKGATYPESGGIYAYGWGALTSASALVISSFYLPSNDRVLDKLRPISDFVADFNADGLPDAVNSLQCPNSAQKLYINSGLDLVETTSFLPNIPCLINNGKEAGTKFIDLNGDGITDVVRSRYISPGVTDQRVFLGSIRPIRNAKFSLLGQGDVSVEYAYITNPTESGYVFDAQPTYPKVRVSSPVQVVRKVIRNQEMGAAQTSVYSFGNLLAEPSTGRGMLGFQWMQTEDLTTGLKSRTWYRQDFPYVGMVDKSTQGFGGSVDNLSQTTYEYGCYDFDQNVGCQVAPGKRYFVYQTKMVETAKDLAGKALPGKRTEMVYDCVSAPVKCFGNATKVTVTTLNADGTDSGYSKVTDSEYLNDEPNWRLGKVLRSKVTSVTP